MIRKIKDQINYFRSHSIAIRKLSLISNISSKTFLQAAPSVLESSRQIDTVGFVKGPTCDEAVLKEIKQIYEPRISGVIPKPVGAPFKNLMNDEDISVDNPVIKLAFSKEILDAAIDYFGGKILFESLQVLYSYPTEGKLRESQHWHKDFGDSKSFHAIMYLNDVEDPTHGPFVFVNRENSKRIKKSVFIRRINDEDFNKELGDGKIERFYGSAGESILVDPAACYHYGSRCKQARLSIFFTYNTSTPYVIINGLIQRNRHKLFEIGRRLRPDLSEVTLKHLLDIA